MTEFNYQDADAPRRFDLGRALSSDATDALVKVLRQHISYPVNLVIDLGSGTGRFTSILARAFATQTLGVEPAMNMRMTADAKPHPASVRFVDGQAESIPLGDGSADLVFMSQVWHHIADGSKAFREIHRVLTANRMFCIRQTTRENLDSYFYQRFFPATRALDERRLPDRGGLIRLAESCGFRLVAVETLGYQIGTTSAEYIKKIALRAYSDLELIDDEAFEQGLEALREFASTHTDYPKTVENDLIILAKR